MVEERPAAGRVADEKRGTSGFVAGAGEVCVGEGSGGATGTLPEGTADGDGRGGATGMEEEAGEDVAEGSGGATGMEDEEGVDADVSSDPKPAGGCIGWADDEGEEDEEGAGDCVGDEYADEDGLGLPPAGAGGAFRGGGRVGAPFPVKCCEGDGKGGLLFGCGGGMRGTGGPPPTLWFPVPAAPPMRGGFAGAEGNALCDGGPGGAFGVPEEGIEALADAAALLALCSFFFFFFSHCITRSV